MRSLFSKLKDKFAREKSADESEPAKAEVPAANPGNSNPKVSAPTPQVKSSPAAAPRPQSPPAAKPAAVRPTPPPQPRVHHTPEKVNPYALTGSAQSQADWMLHQLGRAGKGFIAAAEKSKWTAQEGAMRPDVSAAMIAYRLVLACYNFHQDQPARETLRLLRTAMTALLHRAGETGPKCEELLKAVEVEVAEAVTALRANNAQPFKSFYASLGPSFGGTDGDLHARYGALLKDLYSKIESALLARHSQVTG